ncbi:MAG: hypothetical protein K1X29_10100 [Bdellovibrionales bacterium]|nr:hypothetical protein [Bdellovibrionales bacterium]
MTQLPVSLGPHFGKIPCAAILGGGGNSSLLSDKYIAQIGVGAGPNEELRLDVSELQRRGLSLTAGPKASVILPIARILSDLGIGYTTNIDQFGLWFRSSDYHMPPVVGVTIKHILANGLIIQISMGYFIEMDAVHRIKLFPALLEFSFQAPRSNGTTTGGFIHVAHSLQRRELIMNTQVIPGPYESSGAPRGSDVVPSGEVFLLEFLKKFGIDAHWIFYLILDFFN